MNTRSESFGSGPKILTAMPSRNGLVELRLSGGIERTPVLVGVFPVAVCFITASDETDVDKRVVGTPISYQAGVESVP